MRKRTPADFLLVIILRFFALEVLALPASGIASRGFCRCADACIITINKDYSIIV